MDSLNYIKRRSPKNITYLYDERVNSDYIVNINDHLFSWVVENIFRNALDSMGEKGQIKVTTGVTSKYVYIDISDTGKAYHQASLKLYSDPDILPKKGAGD